MSRRRDTSDDITVDGRRLHITRPCNGCQRYIGEATDEEINAVMRGRALPDVRDECSHCTPGVQA